ncbi:hypothetical protein, partial [Rhizobium rhizogenes]|uniref:hypothetical protein n=1 Tax=Rhizobium rhizogenes TaxID=359 RepID=UPI001AED209B
LHSSSLVNPRSDFHDDVNRLRTNVSGIGASVKQRLKSLRNLTLLIQIGMKNACSIDDRNPR